MGLIRVEKVYQVLEELRRVLMMDILSSGWYRISKIDGVISKRIKI